MNVIDILKKDHRTVRDLFNQLEGTRGATAKAALARKICLELSVHAEAEERIFYPAARGVLSGASDAAVQGAVAEHRSLKALIAEIAASSAEDSLFDARLALLREHVEQHMLEEEHGMFSKLQKTDLDLEEVGAMFAQVKAGIRARMGGSTPLRGTIRMPARASRRARPGRSTTLAAAA